jgi:leader peptidase (prepilin peptidase) / N-methyltransferase
MKNAPALTYGSIEATHLLLRDNINIVFALVLIALLVTIAIIDFRMYIIPDVANLALLVLGVAYFYLQTDRNILELLMGVLLAGGSIWLFRICYFYLRGQQGLGLGDVKFMAAASAWLSVDAIPIMMLLSCISALAFAIISAVCKGRLTAKSRIAFGPHLAVGLGTMWSVETFWI